MVTPDIKSIWWLGRFKKGEKESWRFIRTGIYDHFLWVPKRTPRIVVSSLDADVRQKGKLSIETDCHYIQNRGLDPDWDMRRSIDYVQSSSRMTSINWPIFPFKSFVSIGTILRSKVQNSSIIFTLFRHHQWEPQLRNPLLSVCILLCSCPTNALFTFHSKMNLRRWHKSAFFLSSTFLQSQLISHHLLWQVYFPVWQNVYCCRSIW